jgi:hypothetical protein
MRLLYILVIIKIIESIKVTDFCHQISNDNKLINCHGKHNFSCSQRWIIVYFFERLRLRLRLLFF